MEKIEKFLFPNAYKKRKSKEYEYGILFGDSFKNKQQRKENPNYSKEAEDDLFFKIIDICNKQEEENKKGKNKGSIDDGLDFDLYSQYYETPINYWTFLKFFTFWRFGAKEETKSNFKYNTKKLVQEYKIIFRNFLIDINYNPDMHQKEIKSKIKGDSKRAQYPKEEYEMIQGTGKFAQLSIFFFCALIPMIVLYLLSQTVNYNKEKYNSISYINGDILNNIKNNEDIKNLDEETKDNLSLSFFKFADLAYIKRAKEEENRFPEPFMNWEIINYKLIEETDNYFYVLKNDQYKQLIFAFPGTTSPLQLIEEIFGSSFKNFHINNKNILISTYFGKRISELMNYIYTPEVNELIKNGYKVISTGHSLGGANAQAFIYFSIVENKISKNNFPTTFTFNQPRVGNVFFSKFLDENACNLRVTKENDIVSDIPMANFGFIDMCKYYFGIRNSLNEYVHTENELTISGGKSLHHQFKK